MRYFRSIESVKFPGGPSSRAIPPSFEVTAAYSLGRGQEKENGVGESREQSELTRTRRMRLDLAPLFSRRFL